MSDEIDVEDMLGTGTTIWDALDFAKKLGHGGKAGGVDSPVVSAISTALDIVSIGRGGYDVIEGAGEGDTQQVVEGAAGMADGGLGIAATLLGNSTAGALVGAFSAGYGAGDMIAPHVIPELGQGYADGPDENGTYHPSSGVPILDDVIGWFTD